MYVIYACMYVWILFMYVCFIRGILGQRLKNACLQARVSHPVSIKQQWWQCTPNLQQLPCSIVMCKQTAIPSHYWQLRVARIPLRSRVTGRTHAQQNVTSVSLHSSVLSRASCFRLTYPNASLPATPRWIYRKISSGQRAQHHPLSPLLTDRCRFNRQLLQSLTLGRWINDYETCKLIHLILLLL